METVTAKGLHTDLALRVCRPAVDVVLGRSYVDKLFLTPLASFTPQVHADRAVLSIVTSLIDTPHRGSRRTVMDLIESLGF